MSAPQIPSPPSEPEVNRQPENPGVPGVPPARWFVHIIEAVQQPIGMFTLLSLIMMLLILAALGLGERNTASALLLLFGLIVAAFVGVMIYAPSRFYIPSRQPNPLPPVIPFRPPPKPPEDANEWDRIYGADKPPPDMDKWYRMLRPTLHQASFYTVPTYYLDANLNVLDFNVAFDLVFRDIAGRLRGKHVNWFIDKLANKDAVRRHGTDFTNEIERTGRFPFVDLEPIEYDSVRFGRVKFTKVASQLHDTSGRLQGWAVALMVRSLADWSGFESALEAKLNLDKLWSVYAGPYDRVLMEFQPYTQLIRDVTSVVPNSGLCVGDLGAGTGNVSIALHTSGHRVYAVETNIGMLDRLAMKTKGMPNISLVKSSVEYLDCFKPAIFDAVVMVNVLYALDDPLRCLKEIARLLKPGGVLGFSTTHRETKLDQLLAAIEADVRQREPGAGGQLRADYDVLARVNREIETTIARRHERATYLEWVKTAGFEVTKVVNSTYHAAVMLVHARKK